MFLYGGHALTTKNTLLSFLKLEIFGCSQLDPLRHRKKTKANIGRSHFQLGTQKVEFGQPTNEVKVQQTGIFVLSKAPLQIHS